MGSLVGSEGYLEMARTLCQMAMKSDSGLRFSYSILAKIEGEQEKGREREKSALEYANWSEILRKSGCPFLSQLASQWSHPGIKTIN